MNSLPDRNPYHFIPRESHRRVESWLASAHDMVSTDDPYLYMAVENLMFAERPLVQMEARLAKQEDRPPAENEPLLLMECSSLSILWVFGCMR